MLAVSGNYLSRTNGSSREYKSLLVLHFSGNTSYPFATATATSSAPGYSPSSACDGRLFLNDYEGIGSFLPGQLRTMSQGWKGGQVSDELGMISEELEVNYKEQEDVSTVFFKALSSGTPEDFSVLLDGVEICNVQGNKEEMWYCELAEKARGRKLTLRVSKTTQPGTQIHLVEFGTVRTIILDDDDIVDYKVVTEVRPAESVPVGGVSSNELSVTLNNEYGWFTQNMNEGFLSPYIKTGVPIHLYTGLCVSDEPRLFEFTPCGEFFASDWNAPSSSLEASLIAYDILYRVGNSIVPLIPVYTFVRISFLIRKVLEELGIPPEQIVVDPGVTATVPIGWIPKGNGYEALNELCTAGNAAIAATYDRKIKIFPNRLNTKSIRDWHDNNQIIDISNPVVYHDVYEGVRVNYAIPEISEYREVATLKAIELAPGINTFDQLELNTNSPIMSVSKLVLREAKNVDILSAHFGAWEGSLVIRNNTDKVQEIDVSIFGRAVDVTRYSYQTTQVPSAKILSIESDLIQHPQLAEQFAQDVLTLVRVPDRNYNMTVRGDLAVELLDLVTVWSEADHMKKADVLIIGQDITYTGGLEVVVRAQTPLGMPPQEEEEGTDGLP